MTCDEFEAIGWDAQGSASSTDAQRAAAAEHAVSCARCGALRNSWEATRLELRSLAQLTTSVEAPARVEMRLRQQFRTEYHTPKVRRTAVVTAWTLEQPLFWSALQAGSTGERVGTGTSRSGQTLAF